MNGSHEQVERAGWLGLRFADAALEASYRRYHAVQAMPLQRNASVASMAAWVLILGYMRFAMPEFFSLLAVPVALAIFPILIVWFVLTGRPEPGRALMPVALASNVVAGALAIPVGQVIIGSPVLGLGGCLVILSFALFFLRLPLHVSLAAAAFSVTLFAGTLVWGVVHGGLTTLEVSTSAIVVAAFTMNGAFAAHGIEAQTRQAFLDDRTIQRQQAALEEEKAHVEALLLNVLPAPIAARLQAAPGTIADAHGQVSILFSDIVGFTPLAGSMPPEALVALLNRVFSRFDDMTDALGVEKIKTIGDAYMLAAGLPEPRPDHAEAAVRAGLEMLRIIDEVNAAEGTELALRIGVYTGEVVAGVIGKRKFVYDLWGDAVNVAARMESHGVVGAVHVGESTAALLPASVSAEPRGEIDVKGKGAMRTFLVRRVHRGASA